MKKRLRRKGASTGELSIGSAPARLELPKGLARYGTGSLFAGGAFGLIVTALIISHFSPEAQYERAAKRQIAQQRIDARLALEAKQSETQERQDQADLILEQQRIDAQIAHARYQAGCTMPWKWVNRGTANESIQAIALSPDVVYTDGSFGVAMAVGDKICDDNGLSGDVGRSGKLQDPRRASDMSLVNQRFDDSMGWHHRPIRSSTDFAK